MPLAALHGAELRKLRTRAGWTQRELGTCVPIAHSRTARFQPGSETPPRDICAKRDELLHTGGDLTDS